MPIDLTPEALDALVHMLGEWAATDEEAQAAAAITALRARLAEADAELATALELIGLLEDDQARRDAQPTPEAVARAALEWLAGKSDPRGYLNGADIRAYLADPATLTAIIANAEGGE
jgi:hypothetical protein